MSENKKQDTDGAVSATSRKWTECVIGVGFKPDFSVMQYNVLATPYMNGGVAYNLPQELWGAPRFRRIIEEVERYTPDVLCLQEVEVDLYYKEFQLPLKQIGMTDGVFFRRPNDKPDACAVFWRGSTFSMVERHNISYNNMICTLKNQEFGHDNVGQVVLLKHLATGRFVIVANTHLFWEPTEEAEAARVSQLATLLDAVKRLFSALESEENLVSVVVCGDFNSKPHGCVYNLCDHSPLQLISAYAVLKHPPTSFNVTPGFKGCLDYIWYKSNLLLHRLLSPIPDVDPTSGSQLYLPNPDFPSDHICIAAQFSFVR